MATSSQIYIQRWQTERDAEAFGALVDRYAGMVYGACRRVLGDAAEAEDVAQECFQALATSPRVPADHVGPWLHRVAVRLATSRVRANVSRRNREARYFAAQPTATTISWNDVYEYVNEAIAALPDDQRVPIVAHYLERRTHADIATELGVSRQTVTHRIGEGIERVRKDLRRRGLAVGAVPLAGLLDAHAADAAPGALLSKLSKIAIAGVAAGAGNGTTIFLPAIGIVIGGLVVLAAWTGFEHYPRLQAAPELSAVKAPALEQADTKPTVDAEQAAALITTIADQFHALRIKYTAGNGQDISLLWDLAGNRMNALDMTYGGSDSHLSGTNVILNADEYWFGSAAQAKDSSDRLGPWNVERRPPEVAGDEPNIHLQLWLIKAAIVPDPDPRDAEAWKFAAGDSRIGEQDAELAYDYTGSVGVPTARRIHKIAMQPSPHYTEQSTWVLSEDGLRLGERYLFANFAKQDGVLYPRNITVEYYKADGTLKQRRIAIVKFVEVNPEVQDADFQYEPPAGTRVYDSITGRNYKVGERGERTYDP